jgi:hypothetical protein
MLTKEEALALVRRIGGYNLRAAELWKIIDEFTEDSNEDEDIEREIALENIRISHACQCSVCVGDY